MIGIIDYGLGNIMALANVYRRLNIPYLIVQSKADVKSISKFILPGVGAFDTAMSRYKASGLAELIHTRVIAGTPILGICVGMQMLGKTSEEGSLPGLGWINATIKKIKISDKNRFPLPHMGWNDVVPKIPNSLFKGLEVPTPFYFLHSYEIFCSDETFVVATTEYSSTISVAVNSKNIFGVQFHPEKSHLGGELLLKNFAELTC